MRVLAKLRRSGRGVAVGVVASVLLGSAAAAYWTAASSGGTTATATTSQAVTVSPGVPTTQVFPGGSAAVAVTLSNPNAFPVRVRGLVLDTARGTGGFGVDGGHASCGVASLSYSTQTNGGTGWTVPPRVGGVDGSLPAELTGALSMAVGAADACQGAGFTVYLDAQPA
jgi:hypothetical protein